MEHHERYVQLALEAYQKLESAINAIDNAKEECVENGPRDDGRSLSIALTKAEEAQHRLADVLRSEGLVR